MKNNGIPQNSRDAFDILQNNELIASGLGNRLKAMVGFRSMQFMI